MQKRITVKEVLKVTKGILLVGDENQVWEDFCKDTRELKQNEIYVGIKGEKFDGSLLYKEALEKGAKGCLLQETEELFKEETQESKIQEKCQIPKEKRIQEIAQQIQKKYPTISIILVKDTVKALQQIATYKRSLYNIPVVAITGSVGKTSTKDIIASVLSRKYKVLKTEGNYNNEIGLPLTVLRLKDHEAMVVEMGMSSFGEISLLTNIAKPDVAVITNIGTAHIAHLGSRENILKAKLEILEGLKENGTVVINNDNDLLHSWYEKEKNKYNITTYGIQSVSDIMAKNIQTQEDGSSYSIKINKEEYNVQIKVGGEHFVYNSLCAISVSKVFDIPMEEVLDGILKFELTKRRMEIKHTKEGAIVINDCYNANYDSMKAALIYLGKMHNTRKIAVLGDMLELGEYSEKLHRAVGEEVYNNKIDLLICVGKESENIVKKANEMGMKKDSIFMYKTNEEAIEKLKEIIQSEDAILLKASNGLKFIQICEAIC